MFVNAPVPLLASTVDSKADKKFMALFIGFIDAEGRIIVIIIGNSKLQHRLVVLVYFSIASHKTRPLKILIL